MLGAASNEAVFGVLQFVMLVLTSLSIAQRLNDAGIQRALMLLLLIPYLGWLIMTFLLFSSPQAAKTRYGYPGVHTESQLRSLRDQA